MEVFSSEDVSKVLWKKLVVVIGDSIQRCVYKDLVCLLSPGSKTRYLSSKELKAKGEIDFLNDKLLQGGQLGDVQTGISYREVRQYDSGTSVVKFYFVTRCYSDHLESILNELKTIQPHAVIMNSCLWDLHRYGPHGPDSYHNNMKKLMAGLKRVIPSDAIFIWNATLPLDSKCKGGFLLPYFENIPSWEIIEANFVAADIVLSHGYIYLDLHSVFVNQLHLRANDGIHWNHLAHRRISNLILLHLCRAWNMPVPKTMPLDIPMPPRLQPLRERPRNTSLGSYTSHLFVNRYGFNSSSDARYKVQKPSSDNPNSYKDRFRLMGNPIATSIVVSKNNQNCGPLISSVGSNPKQEGQQLPPPIYTSTPTETKSKTKSFLQGKEVDVNPINEVSFNQKKLGLAQLLNHSSKESSDTRSIQNIHSPINSKTDSPCSSNATYDRENSLPSTALKSTLSQSSTSTLVVQVSSPCLKEKGALIKKESTTFILLNNPGSPMPHGSKLNKSDTCVTPFCTKTTPCIGKQLDVKAVPPTSHVSHMSIPNNQVLTSKATKPTPCKEQVVAPLKKVNPLTTCISSMPVNNKTECGDKANAPCSTGNGDALLADVLPGKIMKVLTKAMNVVKTTQQTPGMSVKSTQKDSPLNMMSQKSQLPIDNSSLDTVSKTTVTSLKQVGGVLTENQNISKKSIDASELSNKAQTDEEGTKSMERRITLKDLKLEATNVVELKRQLQESVLSNTCSKSMIGVESKEETPSTKFVKKGSSPKSRKRKATHDSTQKTKQAKIEEREKEKTLIFDAESKRPLNVALKRKAMDIDNTATKNKSQQHSVLGPTPAKRDKIEYKSTTAHHLYTTVSGTPISGQSSTVTSSLGIGQSAIPVLLGNYVETTNQPPQGQCIPSYQNNCYWMESQQSLQDVQQQQLWFNTILSRGRAGAWRNTWSLQPSLYTYYNQNTSTWDFYNQFYDNIYRY